MQSIQQKELNPYIGPRPFGRNPEDQRRFFGRNSETEEIITLIFSHQLTLIYAQSGAGKTSILNAQVTTELEKNGFEVLPLTRVGFSPTAIDVGSSLDFDNDALKISNVYMFNALCSMKPDIDPKLLSNKSLVTFLNDYFPPKSSAADMSLPQVIIFDQLEELFNLYPQGWHEQQENFFKQVAEALDKRPLLRIVFVIREDYLGELDPFAWILPEKLRPRFRLERLRKAAAIYAIKGPLESRQFHFDEYLVEQIAEDLLKIRIETITGKIHEMKGEFIEPIQLQVVCQRLWRERLSLSNTLSPHDLEVLGDVDAALTDFYVNAIRKAAKQSGICEGDLRSWFEEKLITSSGTRGIVHRDTESTGGMPNRVADILEDMHLIRKEWRSGSPWYEITHDRLIQPIKNSNKSWRYEIDLKKRSRTALALKIIIPIVAAVAVLSVIAFTSNYMTPNVPPVQQPPPPALRVDITIGGNPVSVAVNPATNMVYVANSGSNTVLVIDAKTNQVVASDIPVGQSPEGIAVNPATNIVYVTNFGSNTVSVIDAKTNQVVANIPTKNPFAIAVNPTNNMVYIADASTNTIDVIDGSKTKPVVVDNITVGQSPDDIAVNSATNMVYVANYGSNTVSVIDAKTNQVVASDIPLVKNPFAIAVNPTNNMTYVVNRGADVLSIVDGKTNSVVYAIKTDQNQSAIAVNPATNMVYVANYGSNTVSVIDGSKANIEEVDIVVPAPSAIAVNPITNMIYVTNHYSNSVYVIDGKTNSVIANVIVGVR